MKKFSSKLLILVLIIFSIFMVSCTIVEDDLTNNDDLIVKPNQDNKENVPIGKYKEDTILVKYSKELTSDLLGNLEYTSFEKLYKGSKWYLIKLKETFTALNAYNYLNSLNIFEAVDFDYIMKADGEVQSVDISGNTYADELQYLDSQGIKDGWNYLAENDKNPGGSNDVIIAIIDTGVDYNHLDLRDNIWVNTAEIPNNGIDDDNNGYIDDINGWNCVGDNNNPMDDNGHGTHVAGIAASSNNEIGTIGVAYNCKIMCLKAGSSSGLFNSSDIAEAVEYAYMNGASVINMSFGGTSISRFTEEALENAYNQCVLVAAAGNNGMCNQPLCPMHMPNCAPCYPGSLPYVIGVMSVDQTCTYESGFSNFDHYLYNEYEYDVYACGENVKSTWPNNKYASLSGTSMASPVVAGIAGVLRSYYSDREVYSNKFITSQIVRSHNSDYYGVADLYTSLTQTPNPHIYALNDVYIFDNVEFSEKNNGNGVIDAGETIRLAVELINRGGVASNVTATIDVYRNNDSDIVDPYFTITKDTVKMSNIGTYSVRDFGKIYDDEGNLIGTEKYFEFIVDESCPNSYYFEFNLTVTCENGLEVEDDKIYTANGAISCMVNKGYHLPQIITEDTTFKNDKLYIVSNDVIIAKGVTVNFEPGCEIQFYDNREIYNSPKIIVYGELNFNGVSDDLIEIYPNELYYNYICLFLNYGTINFDHVKSINLRCENDMSWYQNQPFNAVFTNSYLLADSDDGKIYIVEQSSHGLATNSGCSFDLCSNSYIELLCIGDFEVYDLSNCFIFNYILCVQHFISINSSNNIFYSDLYITHSIGAGRNEKYIFVNSLENNKFMAPDDCSASSLVKIYLGYSDYGIEINKCEHNEILGKYKEYASQIIDNYIDSNGNFIIDINDKCSNESLIYPHILKCEIINEEGKVINKIGNEIVKVRITFNTEINTENDINVYFGSVKPYSDYEVKGEFVSPTVWEGTYELKAYIENGLNYIHVENAVAASDPTLKVYGDYQLFEFNIDTTDAMSMNIQANPTNEGIELTWVQDDYETLMGYNIYRSEEKDGNFVKINPYILSSDELSFLDDNAEPGQTYWYTFTVVLSDFTESNPAGKVVTTARDTLAPNLYHTPVNQGYLNNNLIISCTATDNIAITKVMLYYRIKGTTEWKSLQMVKQNDKYNATIFGSELSLGGMEYYIVAQDSQNTIYKGSQELPYNVIIKDSSSIIKLGDVDGDGIINTKDALMIIRAINDELILTDDQFKRADLNKDNILSSVEALRILQYINGNVNSLEMN